MIGICTNVRGRAPSAEGGIRWASGVGIHGVFAIRGEICQYAAREIDEVRPVRNGVFQMVGLGSPSALLATFREIRLRPLLEILIATLYGKKFQL